MAFVSNSTITQTSFPASRQLQHGRALVIGIYSQAIKLLPLLHYLNC
ncbi:unnamed protein product, partial [marine sediment metagenome]